MEAFVSHRLHCFIVFIARRRENQRAKSFIFSNFFIFIFGCDLGLVILGAF